MTIPTEESDIETRDADENASLLSEAPRTTTTVLNAGNCKSRVSDDTSSTRLVLIGLLLIYLFQAGISASAAPSMDIIGDIICRHYHSDNEPGAPGQSICKAGPMQSKLAGLKGMSALLTQLPGL